MSQPSAESFPTRLEKQQWFAEWIARPSLRQSQTFTEFVQEQLEAQNAAADEYERVEREAIAEGL